MLSLKNLCIRPQRQIAESFTDRSHRMRGIHLYPPFPLSLSLPEVMPP